MPISNKQARKLAERVWSDAMPPHTSALAEAILDVLARVAELEGTLRHVKGLVLGASISGWTVPPRLKAWLESDQSGDEAPCL